MSFRKYAEYKESGVEWLGEVPKHWVIGKVKYVTENLDKSRVPLSSLERGKRPGIYPYYGASGIIDYIDDYLFDEDTILFGEDGANLLARSTPLAFLATGKYWVNNHAHVLKAKDGLNRFWVMVLENIDITPVVSGSAQPKLTSEALGNLNVVYPPSIDERREILTFLDKETTNIDTLIDKQEQLITLLQEKRQAIISHTVTKGLNPNVRMKDSGIEWLGEVPEHWIVKKLGYIATKIGSGKTPRGGSKVYLKEGILFLRSQNVHDTGLILKKTETIYISEEMDSEMSATRVKPGDILLNITGASIGRTCIVPADFQPANVNQHVCIIRVPKDLQYYLSYFLKSVFVKSQIDAFQSGASREGLNFEQISKIVLCFPSSSAEILKIVSRLQNDLRTIDQLLARTESAINLLKERRTALISAAVTGKIDVRNAV